MKETLPRPINPLKSWERSQSGKQETINLKKKKKQCLNPAISAFLDQT
jgi:hypothetical protein